MQPPASDWQGKCESRGKIPPAQMPARWGKALRAQVAALDEWHHGRVPAARFHPPAVGFALFCGEGAFPRPQELCDWSMVPGAACWRAEAEVRPGGVGVVAAVAELAMEHVTEGSWESLPVPLHPRVLGVLRELGFPHMTPVQVPGAGDVGPRCAGGRWGKGGSGRARHPLNWTRPVGVRTRILEFSPLRLGLLPRLSAAPTRVMPSWLMIARQRRQAAAHLCQGLHRPHPALRCWDPSAWFVFSPYPL